MSEESKEVFTPRPKDYTGYWPDPPHYYLHGAMITKDRLSYGTFGSSAEELKTWNVEELEALEEAAIWHIQDLNMSLDMIRQALASKLK